MALSASTSKYVFWALNVLLGVAFVMELAAPKSSGDWDGATIALAAAASIAALSRRLPLQNVVAAALITALIGTIAHALSANPNLSLPFGPIVFRPGAGAKIFNIVPWTIPLLWVLAIFNGRGVARLILRPWRKFKNYGFWLIGGTAALAVVFDVALEPFAWHVKHFWFWQPTRLAVTWEGTSLLNFLGWAGVSLLIMMFASPSLIRKQPGHSGAPDFHPLIVWLGALVLCGAGAAEAHEWAPLGLDAGIAVVTAFFAIRGARW
jgi:uncharacterized membrane protein